MHICIPEKHIYCYSNGLRSVRLLIVLIAIEEYSGTEKMQPPRHALNC